MSRIVWFTCFHVDPSKVHDLQTGKCSHILPKTENYQAEQWNMSVSEMGTGLGTPVILFGWGKET